MNRLTFIFLFFSYQLFGQIGGNNEFYPLTPIDTIYNSEELKNSRKLDSLNSENYFFTYKNNESESGLFFTKKEHDQWMVFEFESDLFKSSNTVIKGFRRESDDLISIQVLRFPSGACSNTYGVFILLNIRTCKAMEFWNYHYEECYDELGEVYLSSECNATIEVSGNSIKVNNNNLKDSLNCFESAEYEIHGDKLIKTKYYFKPTQRLYPVICTNNICTGMKFTAFKSEFPKVDYKKSPLYEYGLDSDRLGYEIYKNGEIQFFLTVSSGIITGITFVSSEYTFNGINTTTKVNDILNMYPDSKIYMDLISEWEYISIPDEKITLIFKTDHTNRIGIYGPEPEDAANGIRRKDAEVDLIETF